MEMNFKKKIFSFMIPSVQYDAHDGRTFGQKYTPSPNFVQKWPMVEKLAFYQNLYLVLNTVVIGMVRFKPKFAPIQTYSLLKILIYKLQNYQIIKNY